MQLFSRQGRKREPAFPGRSDSDFDAPVRFGTESCWKGVGKDFDLLVHLALCRSPKLRRLAVHLSVGETSLERSSSRVARGRFGVHPVGAVRAIHRSCRRYWLGQSFNAETRRVGSAVQRRCRWRHRRWNHEDARPGGPPWLFRLLHDDRVPSREISMACIAVTATEWRDVASREIGSPRRT